MAEQEMPRYATAPEDVICEIVRSLAPSCAGTDVAAVVTGVFRQRPQRRMLAKVLTDDPALLTSGRPEGPRSIERLIRALREHGVDELVLPRCGDCGRERPLQALAETGRICSSCKGGRRTRSNPCVICGSVAFASRDRDGRPRCRRHPPDADIDPAHELGRLLTAQTGLAAETIIRRCARSNAVVPVNSDCCGRCRTCPTSSPAAARRDHPRSPPSPRPCWSEALRTSSCRGARSAGSPPNCGCAGTDCAAAAGAGTRSAPRRARAADGSGRSEGATSTGSRSAAPVTRPMRSTDGRAAAAAS